MVHEIGKPNSIFNQFLAEVRDHKVQLDRTRFRLNMERLGEIMAYELSKKLDYSLTEIQTPLGSSMMRLPEQDLVLATILRAGLPFHQGMLRFFDKADSAFISAYRKHEKGSDSFHIEVEYLSSPGLDDKVLIIADPMLATGMSMVEVYKALVKTGQPKSVHVVCLLATLEGITLVKKHLPASTVIWVGAIDDELTAQAYIVPGLGDAGDLSYGKK